MRPPACYATWELLRPFKKHVGNGFFPGVHAGTRFVGTACLGSGARPLIGTGEPSPRSFL